MKNKKILLIGPVIVIIIIAVMLVVNNQANQTATQASSDSPTTSSTAVRTGSEAMTKTSSSSDTFLTTSDTIGDLIEHPAFGDFGPLMVPREDWQRYLDLPLSDMEMLMPYHSQISAEDSVGAVNRLIEEVDAGEQIFYSFYPEEQQNNGRENTGLFYYRGEPGAPFAIIAPGGGFSYVGSLHEGFTYARELSDLGYNAFVINYQLDTQQRATENLAAAITYIMNNAEELEVSTENYSLWGSSAGARMVANIGTDGVEAYGGEFLDKPSTIVTAYTGHQNYSSEDVPTFAVVSEDDAIASSSVMYQRIENLKKFGIPAEILTFQNVGHGFGLGVGTEAEGWLNEAVRFWEEQMSQ